MKIIRSSILVSLSMFAAMAVARADESLTELNELVDSAKGWLLNYQSNPKKAIPADVFEKAEGIFFFKVVGGSFIIGAQGGEGFAMKREDGKWTPPVFYRVGSGSIGAQVGGGETTVMMFLMNDAGLKILTSDETAWTGTTKAVGGPSSASASSKFSGETSAKQNTDYGAADVFYYVTASGLEASAAVKGTQSNFDSQATDTYYGKQGLTRQAVFNSTVTMPANAQSFAELLEKFAAGQE